MSAVLVFGARGALGSAMCEELERSYGVIRATRSADAAEGELSLSERNWWERFTSGNQLAAVVWAQGANQTDSVLTAEPDSLEAMFQANVGFVHETMQTLVTHGAIRRGGRTVIISSVWQDLGRTSKFSYMVSKSALAGFVRSAAIDLAAHDIAVNAVLPGVIDTPMTRANLSPESIERIETDSIGGALATASDVARTVAWLASDASAGVNAQFIAVDNGWSVKRSV